MFNFLLNKIKNISKILICEVVLNENNELVLNCYNFQLKNNKLFYDPKEFISINILENNISKLNKKNPCYIFISNDLLITKEFEINLNEVSYNDNSKLSFLGKNINDFSIFYNYINNKIFISAIRKEKLNNIIDFFNKNKILISSIVPECNNFKYFANLLSVKDTFINYKNFEIKIDNEEVSEIHISDSTIDTNNPNENISNASFLLAGIDYFSEDYLKLDENDDFKSYKINFINFLKYKLLLFSSAFVVFIILLLNFLKFEELRNENNYLKSNFSNNDKLSKEIDSLKKNLENNRMIYEKFYVNFNSNNSIFIDNLISKIPNEIKLTKISICPIDETLDFNTSLQINNNIIIISGEINQSNELKKWIENIKELNWVKNIKINNIEENVNDDFENNNLIFELQINF